jgi:carbon-monoxide dehydrogenase catalytic subunit
MTLKNEVKNKSMDLAVQQMIRTSEELEFKTVWDRYNAMTPLCGFGDTGLCCRHCLQGPCRIDPLGNGPSVGICGATADVMVARGLDRAIAAGTAAHSGHAKHLAHTLKKLVQGKAEDYQIADMEKLKTVSARLGIDTEGRSEKEIAFDLANAAMADFHEKETRVQWAETIFAEKRVQTLAAADLIPKGIDHEISEIMHRTLYGVDADPVNLILGGLRCGVADLAGSYMATDLSDILFGVPQLTVSSANLGTLKADAVNIALHGHNPVLSDVMVTLIPNLEEQAKAVGASGINLVGICCTGNEVIMRHGIPSCTHSVSQEMALITGAVDAMVVDYQCIMPSVVDAAQCTDTSVITTMDISKISGATHIDFKEETASETAGKIISVAIDNFKRRKAKQIIIPDIKTPVVAGFSVETIVNALSKLDAEKPLKPLVDQIVGGNIRGVCLFAGCNNVKVPQDKNFIHMAKKLLKQNVMVVATGCGAGALMRHGFMDPANVDEFCGDGLKAVLNVIGEANNLGGPLPPVLHMGSCVDNSRPVALAAAVASYLDVDIHQLPVVASAAEAVSEKVVSIGAYTVATGLPTHVGVMLPVLGGPLVTEILTEKVKDITGGYFIVDLDPDSAADKLLAAIDERRAALGLD